MKTKLTVVIQSHPRWQEFIDATERSVKQAILDTITPDVMKELTPNDLEDHTIAVYDLTADTYANNPLHTHVTNDLIEFISLDALCNGSYVIDLGAGTGRDAFFMASRNLKLRLDMMGRVKNGIATRDQYKVPRKQFNVLAVEGAPALFFIAQQRQEQLSKTYPELKDNPRLVCDNMHKIDIEKGSADGIWSCAALFTHTPKELLAPVLSRISNGLKRGGVFGASFTQAQKGEKYDKLLLSSTGEIKYFSQPKAAMIAKEAKSYGLLLVQETYDDMCNAEGKVIKKDLFATLFFKKV